MITVLPSVRVKRKASVPGSSFDPCCISSNFAATPAISTGGLFLSLLIRFEITFRSVTRIEICPVEKYP